MAESVDPLPKLDNRIAVQNAVDRVIEDVYTRQTAPQPRSGPRTSAELADARGRGRI